MAANAKARMHVVRSSYHPERDQHPGEPNLNDLPGGRIPGSDNVTKAQDAWFSRKTAVILTGLFAAVAAVVSVLGMAGILDAHAVSVVLWALLGVYFAFGILIVMYRLISKLE
jgi:hypothetical protein